MQHIRQFRSALAGALLALGGAAVASAQQATPAPAPQAQQRQTGERAQGAHRGFRGRGQRALFEGITLSDAEKANLKAVRAKYQPQMKALRDQAKPQMEAARAARQKGDTAALRQLREQAAPHREQMKQLMQAERNDLRNALTPENRAKFDANIKNFESRATKRGARAWNKSGRRAVHQTPDTSSTRG